jgi:hypothetical protein
MHEVPDCQDMSHAYRVVPDGLRFYESVSLINHDIVIIRNVIIFKTIEAMKIWLVDYTMFHHHPFIIKYSDENKCYIIMVVFGQFVLVKERTTVGG